MQHPDEEDANPYASPTSCHAAQPPREKSASLVRAGRIGFCCSLVSCGFLVAAVGWIETHRRFYDSMAALPLLWIAFLLSVIALICCAVSALVPPRKLAVVGLSLTMGMYVWWVWYVW